MTNSNLYCQIVEILETYPDKVCFRRPSAANWTFAELQRDSARTASRLQELNVQAGDRVIAQIPKSVEGVALYLACLQIGAIFVPLNTAYTTFELKYFIDDADPRLVVTAAELPAELSKGRTARTLNANGEGSLREGIGLLPGFPSVHRANADTTAAVLYTSGTTGRAKGAELTHGNLTSNARTLLEYWGMRTEDVLLHALPTYHVHGLFVALHCVLLRGATTIFLERFDVDRLIAQLPHATVLMGVPTFYTRLLAHRAFDRRLVRHMRLFVSGSAPLSEQTFQAFYDRTDHFILERYGMSETLMNTSNPLVGNRMAGTVGFALPGISVRIADDEGTELPSGEVGGIELRGPNVFKGYWRMPEKTAAEFRADGFFRTGDMGFMDAEGRVSIVGRDKDVVISGGLNVYPAEVEAAIDAIPGVLENAVIGAPHPDFGEGVVAVVVCERELELGEINDFLSSRLARFKQPKVLCQVDELPRNAMGKVQKNVLRVRFEDLFQADK